MDEEDDGEVDVGENEEVDVDKDEEVVEGVDEDEDEVGEGARRRVLKVKGSPSLPSTSYAR